MDLEKDLLNKELVKLEANGDKAGVEKLREDAELMGHEDVVAKADAIIAQLAKLVEEVAPDPENKKALVEELGGTIEELEAREEPVDQEIKDVEDVAEKKIEDAVSTEPENQEITTEEVSEIKTLEKPPIPPLSEKTENEKAGEKTPEQIEAEKLKAELETLKTNYQELAKQRDQIEGKTNAIKEQKGYNQELKSLNKKVVPYEAVLAAIMPNKKTGLENLQKLLTLTDESDKDRLQKLIYKIQSISEEDVKNMSQNLSYAWAGISTSILSYIDVSKLGSQDVDIAESDSVFTHKRVRDYEEKIASDPEILANETAKAELTKQLAGETDKIMRLEHKIQSLEN